MTVTAHTLILAGVFVYFGIGAIIAGAITMMSAGFAGRFEPVAILVFFFWPLFYAMQLPGLLLVVVGLTLAGFVTWIVSLIL